MKPRRDKKIGNESFTCKVIEVRVSADDVNVVEGKAQVLEKINDRNEIFHPGSFTKTIQERVLTGRVKITDGHIWTAKDTHAVIIEAEERAGFLWFRAKWSATEDSQQIKVKMLEGIVDEFSIEFRAVRDEWKTVDSVVVRHLYEVHWNGLAILPYSSQGEGALISVRSAKHADCVPFQDLDIAPIDTVWDSRAALIRIVNSAESKGKWKTVRKAFMKTEDRTSIDGFCLQIADIVEGRMMLVPAALAEVSTELMKSNDVVNIALRSQVDEYYEKINEKYGTTLRAPWHHGSIDQLLAEIRGIGQVPPERITNITNAISTLYNALTTEQRSSLMLMLSAEPGTAPLTSDAAISEEQPAATATWDKRKSELRLLEIEMLETSS